MVKSEDKFVTCAHYNLLRGRCSVKDIEILNGYMSRNICGKCRRWIVSKRFLNKRKISKLIIVIMGISVIAMIILLMIIRVKL
jgi:hypothetical protein